MKPHKRTPENLFSLEGRTAIVTGGARGIGLSIVEALSLAGARTAILDLDLMLAQQAAESIQNLSGQQTLAIQADVTREEAVEAAFRQVKETWGRIDIVFCNAGICINAPAETMTLQQWQDVLQVNLTGVFLTAREAGRFMINQNSGGSIVVTASMSGHVVNYPQPQCSYNASKAGVIQLTKSLAVEWAKHQIRVNSISPGYIGTELTLNSPVLEPLIPIWKEQTPQERLGRPNDLQGIALYLASDASGFTTGSDFIIDGGFTSR